MTDAYPAWGKSGFPLLPLRLRQVWAEEELRPWVKAELAEAGVRTLAELGAECVRPGVSISDRLRAFLGDLLEARLQDIGDQTILSIPPEASLLTPASVPCSTRTRNALRGARIEDIGALGSWSIRELLEIRNIGPVALLDLACSLEGLGPAGIELQERVLIGSTTPAEEPRSMVLTMAEVENALGPGRAELVRNDDARFSDILGEGQSSLYELLAQRASGIEESGSVVPSTEQLGEIRGRLDRIDQISMEAQVTEFLQVTSKISDHRFSPLMARMEWNGEGRGITLDEAGALAGVTRERMRQIESRTRKRLPSGPVYMPGLQSALARLRELAPISAESAMYLASSEGSSTKPFHPRSLLAIAKDLKIVPAVTIEFIEGLEVVVPTRWPDGAAEISRLISTRVGTFGLVTLSQITSSLDEGLERCWSTSAIKQLASVVAGVEELVDGWYWAPNAQGSLIRTQTRKMLAATSELDVSTIREGIWRHLKFRQSNFRERGLVYAAPPTAVLREYFRAHSEFTVSTTGKIRSRTPLDFIQELAPMELELFRIIRSQPTQVIDRLRVAEMWAERGHSISSLFTFLSYSAIIERVGDSLYSVRGTRLDPVDLGGLASPRERRARSANVSWLKDGGLSVEISVPHIANWLQIRLPAEARRVLTKPSYAILGFGGEPLTSLEIAPSGQVRDLGDHLQTAGAEEGDILRLEFDLPGGLVSLEVLSREMYE